MLIKQQLNNLMRKIMKTENIRQAYEETWDIDAYGWELSFGNIEIAPCGCQFDALPWLFPVMLTNAHETIDGLPSWWQLNATQRFFMNSGVSSINVIPSEGLRLVVKDEETLEERDFRHSVYFQDFYSARMALFSLIDFIQKNWNWAMSCEEDDNSSADIHDWSNNRFFEKIKRAAFGWDRLEWFAIAYACIADDTGRVTEDLPTAIKDAGSSYTLDEFADTHGGGGGWVHHKFLDAPYLMAGVPNRLAADLPFKPFREGAAIRAAVLNDFEVASKT